MNASAGVLVRTRVPVPAHTPVSGIPPPVELELEPDELPAPPLLVLVVAPLDEPLEATPPDELLEAAPPDDVVEPVPDEPDVLDEDAAPDEPLDVSPPAVDPPPPEDPPEPEQAASPTATRSNKPALLISDIISLPRCVESC
jgi:hypothetical protein